jgi:hypothetical protein
MFFCDWKCGKRAINIWDKLEEFEGLSGLLKQILEQAGPNH